jgi:lipopolysaccharide/colanic/teichoic acid biosynthesis glycosyltransferase
MSDPEKLARLDGTYIKTRTLLLDVKLILATALGRGMGDRTAR